MRPWIARASLVLASGLSALLVAEIALRVAGVEHQVWYVWDPELGHVLRPSYEVGGRGEGERRARTNSAGFYDQEHPERKPPSTFRIAVLGDSFTEGVQVPVDQTFPSVLGRELQRCPAALGRSIEVLSMGVGGFGTAQELILLRDRVWAYSPDAILLAVHTGNDIADNHRALSLLDRPFFLLASDGLFLDTSFRSRAGLRESILGRLYDLLLTRSRVVQVLQHARQQLLAVPPADAGAPSRELVGGRYADFRLNSELFRDPTTAHWREAWDVTEAILRAMRDEVAAHRARFLVATLSHEVQVYPDPAFRHELLQRLGVADLSYPDRRIAAAGERDGFAVTNLAPALQRYADAYAKFLHSSPGQPKGVGHYNETGHRIVGQLLAERACATLLAGT